MSGDVDDGITTARSTAARLPNEIVVLIAQSLDITSLARVQQACKTWHTVLEKADGQIWALHARRLAHCGASVDKQCSFDVVLDEERRRCLDDHHFVGIQTWQQLCRQLYVLDQQWVAGASDFSSDILGGFQEIKKDELQTQHGAPPRPHILSKDGNGLIDVPLAHGARDVWRARLDTDIDAKFILTTSESGSVQVLDAKPGLSFGRCLFKIAHVQIYAHLEYQKGIACWNRDDTIEVWKRWKLVHGTESLEQRGHFQQVASLAPLDGMRGFMLNEQNQLAIISSQGVLEIWDVGLDEPVRLHRHAVQAGATGHIEHDHDVVSFCVGDSGYCIYRKQTGEKLGSLDFSGHLADAFEEEIAPANTFVLGTQAAHRHYKNQLDADYTCERCPLNSEMMELQLGRLEDRFLQSAIDRDHIPSNTRSLSQDEWGAAMLRPLGQSATLFVARSRSGRTFVCTDLHELLSALNSGSRLEVLSKAHRCACIIECGGSARAEDFHHGGWLAVNSGRAAWQVGDRVCILPLPRSPDTLMQPKTPVLTVSSQYCGALPSPRPPASISFMSLHDDGFISTYVHPIFVSDMNRHRQEWSPQYVKSVRIIRCSPPPQALPSMSGSARLKEVSALSSDISTEQRMKNMQARTRYFIERFRRRLNELYRPRTRRWQFDPTFQQRLQLAQAQVAALIRARGQGDVQNAGEQDAADAGIARILNVLGPGLLAAQGDGQALLDPADVAFALDDDELDDEIEDLDFDDFDDFNDEGEEGSDGAILSDEDDIELGSLQGEVTVGTRPAAAVDLDETGEEIDDERESVDVDEEFEDVDDDFADEGEERDVYPT